MSRKYKPNTVKTNLSAAISDGASALTELRDEVQEIVDNAPDGLRETSRIQSFEASASALSEADSEPDIPDSISELPITYTESICRGSQSRAVRCSNAVASIQAARDAAEEYLNSIKDESADDIQTLIDWCDELIGNADGCEWPGMFG